MVRVSNYYKKKSQVQPRRIVFAVLIVLFAAVGVIAAFNIITAQIGYTTSQKEYTELRQYAPLIKPVTVSASPTPDMEPAADPAQPAVPEQEPEVEQEQEQEPEQEAQPSLAVINPDYIGWIWIEDTKIDYPMVQCDDNVKYLSITFSGGKNASGAIFMDSRCKVGFDSHAILYGHNMKNGSMFAGLNRYLESGYLDKHPEIIIMTLNGETLTYRIFDAQVTNASDPAYRLPDMDKENIEEYGTERDIREGAAILVLSTCTTNSDDSERLLVFAVRQ